MKASSRSFLSVACLLACGVVAGFAFAADTAVPKGLKPVKCPDDNAPSEAKIALGKQLYFDTRLSQDMTVSCATCHDPAKGWSNGEAVATGFGKAKGGRSSPTIVNSAYNVFQFWDGRAATLEHQAVGPIQNPIEMAMTLDQVVERINKIEGYRTQFQAVFGTDVTSENMARAIAAYERTVLSGDAPFDRFKAGDHAALSEASQRGMNLFFGKAKCSACHVGHNFTDNSFHNVGIGWDAAANKMKDVGREEQSKLAGDRGSFKTPTLREIARTAPYMHDGSLKTLEEVIDHYDKGGNANPWLDEEIFKLNLTPAEKADLVTFLKEGLAGKDYPDHTPPELPK